MSAQSTGLKWALAATLISGFSVFLNALVVKGIDPLVHTTIKNSVAGLLIFIVLLLSQDLRSKIQHPAKSFFQLFAIAIIGGSLPFYLFFIGLKDIGAVQGALIQKTLVIWVALLAIPLLKEKLSRYSLIGIILLYGSSLVYGIGSLTQFGRGHLYVFLATLLWAIENIIAKKTLKNLSPNLVVGSRMILGSFILIAMALTQNKIALVAKLNSTQWLMLSGLGIVLFGYVSSWYRALKYLPVTVVARILVGATVITSLLQAIFITHILKPLDLAQAILILTGVALVLRSSKSIDTKRVLVLK